MKKNDQYTSLICAAAWPLYRHRGLPVRDGDVPFTGVDSWFLGGLILLVLSYNSVFQNLFFKTARNKKIWEGIKWPKGVKLTAAGLIYALIFKWMGFFLSTFFFLLFS